MSSPEEFVMADAEAALLAHEPDRVHTLERLSAELRTAQQDEFGRDEFTKIFASALRVLELEPGYVAKLFKVSRPTVSRWTRGESAPHPLGRGPVFKLFERETARRLRLLGC